MFNISVNVLGEFNFPTNQSVAFTLYSYYYQQTSSSQEVGQPYNYLIRNGCHNLGIRIFSEYQTEYLKLLPFHSFDHPASLTLTIHLDEYPPGFQISILPANAKKLSSN